MTHDLQAVRSRIRQFILTEFLPGEDESQLADDTELRASGILDSISTLKLVTFVETTFGIEVDPHEASTEFGTIAQIAGVVERKS